MENQEEENNYGNKGLIIIAVILIAVFAAAKLLWDMFV